jgi:hypothetical protein
MQVVICVNSDDNQWANKIMINIKGELDKVNEEICRNVNEKALLKVRFVSYVSFFITMRGEEREGFKEQCMSS